MFKNLQPKTHFESYALPLVMAISALVGTSLYFFLPFEVSVAPFAVLSIGVLVLCYFLRAFYKTFLSMLFVATLLAFLTNAAYVVQNKQTVFLPQKHEQERHWVVGQISKSATYDGRDKVTLENVKIYGVDANKTPKKVRISASEGRLSDFFVGDWVSLEAKLFVPKRPKHANDFDLRRYYWMNEIGATGYVMGSIYRTSWPKGFENKAYRLQILRAHMTGRIIGSDERNSQNVTDSKAVLVALATGKRTYLTEEIYNAYRSSGLAHLLAISGLHVGLVAGFVFFGTRRLLAFSPYLALTYNLKIPAAVLAVTACLFYTVLAGATLPTLRAFLMVSFIFFALILGRLHNSLRILMLTLTLVLFVWPESLLTASFQMSFAAVFALTLFNEFKEKELHSKLKIVQGMTYTKGVFLTSVVAGVATMPVAAWHFGEIHFTGFLVNILAIPLTAFVVMPFAFLGLLFMPIYVHEPFLWVAAKGVDVLNNIAVWGAGLPYGHFVIDKSEVVYLLVACLLMIFCLYFKRWQKTAFVLLTVAAVYLTYASPKPADIFWLRDGKTILLGAEGAGYFAFQSDGSVGEKRIFEDFKVQQTGLENHFRCDAVGCVLTAGEKNVLLLRHGVQPSVEDCALADIIFTTSQPFIQCDALFKPQKDVVAQRVFLKESGVTLKAYKPSNNRVWN